jgi:site-specific recombinase XerD
MNALPRLRRGSTPEASHVFATERADAVNRQIKTIGRRADLPFPVHTHMLRHGYALANAGHDTRSIQAWLGHVNIQHTVRYTALASDRFKDFWR